MKHGWNTDQIIKIFMIRVPSVFHPWLKEFFGVLIMGFEVELKFRVADPVALGRLLADRGGASSGPVDHEDVYFAHPSRDFASTGEAFRIRGEGLENRITYKGPKRSGPTKTREEVEVDFADGMATRKDLLRVFERLGFSVAASVRKRRTSYELEAGGRTLTVTVDHLEALGDFAEVETLVDAEADLGPAQESVMALAGELGMTEAEPRSYLRMLLEKQGVFPRNPPGQT